MMQAIRKKLTLDSGMQIEEKVIFKGGSDRDDRRSIFIRGNMMMAKLVRDNVIDTNKEGELVKSMMNNFAIAIS